MAGTTPTAVTIRSYQVGFGDCFLLSFRYGEADDADRRHVLIDFGSTHRPAGSPTMEMVAKRIAADCGGKLHAVVATHRHADHISGFSGKAGAVIAGLQPDVVLQPWTEHPDAKTNARTAPASLRDRQRMRAMLNDMNAVADAALSEIGHMRSRALAQVGEAAATEGSGGAGGEGPRAGRGRTLVKQVTFLGQTNIRNKSAVQNLIKMGRRKGARAVYASYGQESGLESVLPGVNVRVLGPPTLADSEAILTQRTKDPDEFWHVQGLAARQVTAQAKPLFGKSWRASADALPLETRWFLPRLQAIRAEQLLSIVRILDEALNNTSLILLFQVGKKKLLFPGDAQIENWLYALTAAPDSAQVKKLLRGVDVLKVGHHGSLNATPKSLWKLLDKRGAATKRNRLRTMMSTMKGVHGSTARDTEVPREKLTTALEAESLHQTTETLKKADGFVHVVEIPLRTT